MVWEQFKKTVTENSLIRKNDSILVSVSGGADSVCLLHLLIKLQRTVMFKIAVVHFNHGLRLHASENDFYFVKKLAQKNQLTFHYDSLPVREISNDTKIGIEEAGRLLRYKSYTELAKKHTYTKIALGHHLDDQAETLLFRIIRGTGPRGLAGIPLMRNMEGTSAQIIRPLLYVSKEQIVHYMKQHEFSFRVDHSNLTDMFTRNKIRNKLIPYLERFNPKIKNHLSRLAHTLRDEEEYWLKIITLLVPKVVQRQNGKFILDLNKFNKYHTIIRKRIILHLFSNIHDYVNINSLINLGESARSGKCIVVPGGGWVEKSYNKLIFHPKPQAPTEKNRKIRLAVPGKTFVPNRHIWVHARVRNNTRRDLCSGRMHAYVDWDKLKNKKFFLRFRKPGDTFYPFGLGSKKKIKDFFIDQHIPRQERSTIPLVCAGDAVVWVVGYRTDDRWKITPKTKKILEINIEK